MRLILLRPPILSVGVSAADAHPDTVELDPLRARTLTGCPTEEPQRISVGYSGQPFMRLLWASSDEGSIVRA
jgi:hypothetical protein